MMLDINDIVACTKDYFGLISVVVFLICGTELGFDILSKSKSMFWRG